MTNGTNKRLHKISIFGLLIAGLIFLGLSIFGESRSDLTIGLCLITLANVYSTRLKSKE
jgi:hypothetical protein